MFYRSPSKTVNYNLLKQYQNTKRRHIKRMKLLAEERALFVENNTQLQTCARIKNAIKTADQKALFIKKKYLLHTISVSKMLKKYLRILRVLP